MTQRLAEHWAKKHEVKVFTRFNSKRKKNVVNGVSISSYGSNNPGSFLSPIKKYAPDFTLIYSDVFDFFSLSLELPNICVAPCGGNKICARPHLLKLMKDKMPKSFLCHCRGERDFKLLNSMGMTDRTYVIPIGIDLEEFDKNEMTREDILPKDRKNDIWILNVSNFFPGKGHLHLLDILSRLKIENLTKGSISYIQVCSSMEFAIGQHLEQQWRFRAKKLTDAGISVCLMKDKERKKVVAAFKNSNVFVFPSEKESFGIVTLESMAARLPWVSTSVGIATEAKGGFCVFAAKNQKYDSIFEERVFDNFADKIDKCLKNPSLGEEGRNQVEKEFDWKGVLLPKYDELTYLT